MNISQKFEILQKLDSLFTYSELLPEDFKKKYINDLDHLKKRFSDFKANNNPPVSENKKEAPGPEQKVLEKPVNNNPDKIPMKTFINEPPPPPSVSIKLKSMASFQPVAREQSIQKVPLQKAKKSNFEPITDALIPKLTEEGKKMIGDFSLPIDIYLVLKSIDDKSSIFKLFEESYKLHSTNFINFVNALFYMEQENFIYVTRTEETIINAGLLTFDEIFSEGKVIPKEKFEQALEQHKPPGGAFTNKRLVELKLISNEILGLCMRTQKWISKAAENAPFVEAYAIKTLIPAETETGTKEAEQNIPAGSAKQEKPAPDPAKKPPARPPLPPPVPAPKPAIIEDSYSKLLDCIIPVLNEKGKTIVDSPEHKELAARISIIDGNTSLFEIFKANRESFKNNKLNFLKFILKLDSQEILVYKQNSKNDEGEVWIKFGELLLFLGLISQEKLDYTLIYQQEKKIYFGMALVELKYLDENTVDECLKIQHWLNAVLSNISYESSFVNVIQDVLKDSFKCNVEIGSMKKVSFPKPLKETVYIQYSVTGKLKGRVFYISDRNFMKNLAKTIMTSVGSSETDEFDASYVSAVSSVIITNSLNKLAQMGLISSSEIPKILMEKKVIMDEEVIIADNKTISLVPLINQWGRFAIGLEIA